LSHINQFHCTREIFTSPDIIIIVTMSRKETKQDSVERFVRIRAPKGSEKKNQKKTNSKILTRSSVKRKGKGGKRAGGSVNLPPNLNNSITVRNAVYRYFAASGAGAAVSVSVADMLGALGGVAQSASIFRPWASSFRIHKVCAWPANSNTGADQSYFTLSWNSGLVPYQRDELKSEDLPEGATITRAVVERPPRGCLAGDWVASTASTTANLFTIQTSQGSIVDLHVSYTLPLAFTPGSLTTTSATTGQYYYLPLDGVASNTLKPVHLPTTI